MSLFQSNLRKQIRKLPKFLKFVKIIQYYYSILFIRVLNGDALPAAAAEEALERRARAEREERRGGGDPEVEREVHARVPLELRAARDEGREPDLASRGSVHGERAGKLYNARSRLYRSQILQVKTRWKALAEIYTMHSFAPFWNRIPKNEENHGGKRTRSNPGKTGQEKLVSSRNSRANKIKAM